MKYKNNNKYNMDIPRNKNLRTGMLECGLKYYVLGHGIARPKHGVELRLVVKVGSLMEGADEQGLAHFIEHLGFKGTENFAKYELVRFLQSLGIAYGADLNASTHLLETTFQLSTEISSQEDLVKFQHAVAVLKEWAFHMAFSDHDVTEEKAVINAEYVAKQGLGERLLAKYWASVFDDPGESDCRLAKRMPIGIPDVFMNTSAAQLRQFYEKWYLPQHMAVVVVGDFSGVDGDSDRIVDILVDVFRPLRCKPVPSVNSGVFLKLPQHHRNDVVVVLMDKEVSVPQLSCEFFIPCPSAATTDYLRQDIMRRLICSVYDRRLHSISSGHCLFYNDFSARAPFLTAGISVRQIVRGLLCFGLSATVHSEEFESGELQSSNIKCALKALLTEMKRFSLHGATNDEFVAAKNKWEMLFSDQRDHAQPDCKAIAADLVNYILCEENSIFEDPIIEATLAIDCVRSITLEELNAAILCLDMHLAEAESTNYYCDGLACGSFRVLSGQFPMPKNESDPIFSDSALRSILAEVRAEVSITAEQITAWTQTARIDPATVIAAAERAINIRAEATGRPSVDRACIANGALCTCCVASTSLLPTPAICRPTYMPMIPSTAIYQFSSVDVTEVTLSNGIKVSLKWMPKSSPNRISMQAFALGGSTELSEPEEIIMSRLDSIAEQSFFDISYDDVCLSILSDAENISESHETILRGIDIIELQSRTKTYVNTQRHHNHRGIGGSCPSSNFELLLAFVVLKLTSQRISNSAVEKNISIVKSQLSNMNNMPESQFMEHARLLTCGDIPISRPVTKAAVEAISLDMASDLYIRGFLRDPTEFTFCFVGSLPPIAEVTALLEQYLSRLRSLPEGLSSRYWIRQVEEPQLSPFTLYPAVFPTQTIRDELNIRQADKSSVLVVYRKDIPVLEGTLKNSSMELDAMCKVVEIKLLDYLRIQLGKVYNVVVDHSKNSLSSFSLLTIGFHCEPRDCVLIEEAIQAVIELMQNVGPDAVSLDGVREAMIKKHSRDLDSSSHWLFWILDSYKDKAYDDWYVKEAKSAEFVDVSTLIEARTHKKLDDIRNNLSGDCIKNLICDIFNGVRATVVLSPEEREAGVTTTGDSEELHSTTSLCTEEISAVSVQS